MTDESKEIIQEENPKDIIKIAVRTVVEWILRSGDIDTRSSLNAYEVQNAMLLGAKAHRKIQKSQFGDYKSEAWLSCEFELDEFIISLGGRADGIFTGDDNIIYIDEIKSTLTALEFIDGDNPVHWGQAKCYAYIHAKQSELSNIGVQLTYYQLETEEFKIYKNIYEFKELEDFIIDLIDKYAVWVKFERDWRVERNASIDELKFPFAHYRAGQRELAAAAYRTIIAESKLFANAPTGIGKTISTIFPAIKAMPNSNLTKIFYLTAKTITRAAAYDAIYIMQERGLKFKTVAVTAKDKICFYSHDENRRCSPDYCEYAKGHYDRANDAVYDAIKNNHAITREVIEDCASRYKVCPFEISLDLSLFTDAVICDYNYAFDPVVYLRRFFQNNYDRNYVFLIDEAHNLVDRAREMYSAEIKKSQFAALKKALGRKYRSLKKSVSDIDKYLLEYKRRLVGAASGRPTESSTPTGSGGRAMRAPTMTVQEYEDAFAELLLAFTQECAVFFRETREFVAEDEELQTLHREVLQAYFEVIFYQLISGFYDERYVTFITAEDGDLKYKLFCLDPSYLIGEAMKRAKSSIIFSATLAPLDYFKEILSGGEEDKTASLISPFDRDNLCLVVGANINTKYKEREKSYEQIADYINIVAEKRGNYLVFFPSYEYMKNAYEIFCDKYPDTPSIIQTSNMREQERESFLENFNTQTGKTLVGFCVMGGVFSEGIDLTGDRLNGAIIVGVGLPKLSAERDIIKKYFDAKSGAGYEYAYMYPGMNKVLQAAGRVIRTESDRGIVLLLDERFNYSYYKQLFPEHWRHFKIIRTPEQLEKLIEKF